MKQFTLATEIEATPEVVFGVLADFEHAADNISAIEKMEVLDGKAVGVGMRFRETRKMFGRESTEQMEITAFDPPHGYTVEAESCGAHFAATYRVLPIQSGTKLEKVFSFGATSFLAKLMAPLSKLMLGPMKKCIEADLADIKRVAEQRAANLNASV